jgi:hypothetical protein
MEAAAASRTTLCALPLALLQSVLARLPVDARARACVVCRAWNTALADRSLWTHLDLSPASGVTVAVTRVANNNVLRAAAARAGGQLEALDLSDCNDVSFDAVLAVVTASSATLRELHWLDAPSKTWAERTELLCGDVEALLRAAPELRVLAVDVRCETVAEASRLLRGELSFAPVRVHALAAVTLNAAGGEDEAAVLALAADVAGHAWLAQLTLNGVPLNTAAALDALVDAALARRLRAVGLGRCQLSPASAPALARLLSGELAQLSVVRMYPPLDVPAALLLSNALRASTTLTSFHLGSVGLWHDLNAAVLLLCALTAHPVLRDLRLSSNRVNTPAMRAIAGATLCALVAANAPALRTLNVAHCSLGEAGLGPLLDALPHNTHIHTLVCDDNSITEAFARDRLRPAVQTNILLRKLVLTREEDDGAVAILRELQDMVAARAAAAPQ